MTPSWAALWLYRCDRVGRRTRLRGIPRIENLGSIRLGDDVTIDSRPVQSHLSTGPQGVLLIGDGANIGPGAAISAHHRVRIGEDAQLGPFALLLDTDFHSAGDHRAPGASGPIEIGRGAILGARVTLLRGAKVGDGAVIAAGSVVVGEVAAGAHASGNPARVQRGSRESASIPAIVQRVFNLQNPPSPADGPHSIAAWDSLGALRLLVALEDSLGVTLSEQQVAKVGSVGDLERLAG